MGAASCLFSCSSYSLGFYSLGFCTFYSLGFCTSTFCALKFSKPVAAKIGNTNLSKKVFGLARRAAAS